MVRTSIKYRLISLLKGKNKGKKTNELLKVSRSKQHNIKITFTWPIKYSGMRELY
jgi:hypothetical protein